MRHATPRHNSCTTKPIFLTFIQFGVDTAFRHRQLDSAAATPSLVGYIIYKLPAMDFSPDILISLGLSSSSKPRGSLLEPAPPSRGMWMHIPFGNGSWVSYMMLKHFASHCINKTLVVNRATGYYTSLSKELELIFQYHYHTVMLHVPKWDAEFQLSCNSYITWFIVPDKDVFCAIRVLCIECNNLLPDFQSLARWNEKEWGGISCPRSSNLNSGNVRLVHSFPGSYHMPMTLPSRC